MNAVYTMINVEINAKKLSQMSTNFNDDEFQASFLHQKQQKKEAVRIIHNMNSWINTKTWLNNM